MLLKKLSIKVGADTFEVEGDSLPSADVMPLVKLWFAAIVQGDQLRVNALVEKLKDSTDSLDTATHDANPGA